MDPAWTAWKKNIHNRHEYPPFSEIKEGETVVFKNKEEYHDLFDISREAKAIIGKPGAGTLIDSFGAATPLIMLEPFGEHERKSSELWRSAGFGISYDEWKTSGFDQIILEEMHSNILEKRKKCKDFIQYYKEKYSL
jgi:UDP-N-acetylglucosamine:LPS N-acetylglucosamine transferase